MNVYLDEAATVKPKQEVVDAMMPYLAGDKWYNPSSLYSDGVKAKKDVESARKTIADFIGANANEIYFTASGSEGNCMAIEGFVLKRMSGGETACIITSEIEHKSILECCKAVENLGAFVKYVPVDATGFIPDNFLCNTLEEAIEDVSPENILVSIMLGNNEIGTIQNIGVLSKIAHDYGAVFHCDAVQAFGHIPIDVNYLGVDMLTASSHKIGCPRGTAVLYKKDGIDIQPLVFGSQERGMRGGTENSAGIIGFAKAVELVEDDVKRSGRLELIRELFIYRLEKLGCAIVGRTIRLPNNISILLPSGVGGEEVLYMLDLAGIKCSTGSACNSRSKSPSHVLKAIGLSDEEAARVIRLTISDDITMEEMDYVINEMEKAIKILKDE